MSLAKFENKLIQDSIKTVNDNVKLIVDKISKKYDLDKKELTECFSSLSIDDFKGKSNGNKESKGNKDDKPDDVKTCIETVKSTGVQCTGKVSAKSVTGKYCGRHLGKEKEGEKGEKKEKKRISKKDQLKEANTDVIKKLNENKQKLLLKRNAYDNFEDPETHFVFDRSTQEVYGKQVGKNVEQLNADDIQTCRLKNFKFRMPENLVRKDDDSDEENKNKRKVGKGGDDSDGGLGEQNSDESDDD